MEFGGIIWVDWRSSKITKQFISWNEFEGCLGCCNIYGEKSQRESTIILKQSKGLQNKDIKGLREIYLDFNINHFKY